MRNLFARVLMLAAVTGTLLSCGSDDPTKPDIIIKISPAADTLAVGETLQFSVLVLGSLDETVTWEVIEGVGHGTISEDGLYTAPFTLPDPATATVRATSPHDPAKPGDAVVTLVLPEISVTVDPPTDTLHVGASRRFKATVTGTALPSVTWSVDEGAAYGAVDATGLFTAPAMVPVPPVATLRATSVVDPTRSGAALVTLYEAGPPPEGFVRIPGGSFLMGDGEASCGKSFHSVTLTQDFDLAQTEVTNEQYREMVQWAYDHGYVTANTVSVFDAMGGTEELLRLGTTSSELLWRGGEFRLRDGGHGINPDHPVMHVTWYGAAAYCDWLSLREGLRPAYDHTTWRCNDRDPYRAWGYRLPTDVEWEYAAQYDDDRIYPWGSTDPTGSLANYYDSGVRWTAPVGSFPAEKTIGGGGLYDMAGNVWEWCNDWHQCEINPGSTDPVGPVTGSDRLVRGGGWDTHAGGLGCADRSGRTPSRYARNIGFRVVRTVAP